MKKITTEPTKTNIAFILETLAASSSRLSVATQGILEERLHQPFATGERSPVEVLAHLIHCEARTSEAIYLALLVDEPLLIDVHPERQWGKLLRFDLLPFAELLSYFTLRRTVLLRVLTSLTESQWSKTIREEGKKRKESVYWQARLLALHEMEHLSAMIVNSG